MTRPEAPYWNPKNETLTRSEVSVVRRVAASWLTRRAVSRILGARGSRCSPVPRALALPVGLATLRPVPRLLHAALLLGLSLLLAACEPRIVRSGCTRTSDCATPYVCVDGRCGSECTSARDCGVDRRCVRILDIGRCLIESITQCDASTPCELSSLVCRDERCYNACDACAPDTMCVDDICVLPSADAGGPHDAR